MGILPCGDFLGNITRPSVAFLSPSSFPPPAHDLVQAESSAPSRLWWYHHIFWQRHVPPPGHLVGWSEISYVDVFSGITMKLTIYHTAWKSAHVIATIVVGGIGLIAFGVWGMVHILSTRISC